ncbi:MAG: FemAB family PEP-CTERM system-associated protein [Desulfobacterales bacterium]|nr:FemAB family PEP-CTERM system-associated protein [Desulfobacterales bacterium]
MDTAIKTMSSEDAPLWDAYVHTHPRATLYHLSGWQNIIRETYGHKTYYLMAVTKQQPDIGAPQGQSDPARLITGILPLAHLKHFLFGNALISVPFADFGGILSDDEKTEEALLSKALEVGKKLNVNQVELRHIHPLSCLNRPGRISRRSPIDPGNFSNLVTKSDKIRMLLNLPGSSKILLKSFSSKLRSQIKKPAKEGLYAKIGGRELVKDFLKVFWINMRDLGSPVHSKKIFLNVLQEFSRTAKVVIIYKENKPLAGSVMVGFKDTMENPWASALRSYGRLSPNMLLYWTMISYACDNGFAYFDFGRSSRGEGTYKFKQQWGAKPVPLHWHYIPLNNQFISENESEKSRFEKAIACWKKLPVPVTRILGPHIRKYIGL